jgi:putative DNA-invertase from lambdoid prophage Rac
MSVPFEVHFKRIDLAPQEKCHFLGCLKPRVQLGQSAALYCRVSTADQSCARQERDLKAFAKKAGYKIVGVWKETASGAKDDRKHRKEVLGLAQARKIDVILVTELTRWGRSMLDLLHTLQDLQAWSARGCESHRHQSRATRCLHTGHSRRR